MRYSGSKRRFMKDLLPFIMDGTNPDTAFFDCFGGGMNVISEVPLTNKTAIDTNYFIIKLWQAIKEKGVEALNLPKCTADLSQNDYEDIKRSYLNLEGVYDDYLIGFVGSSCSYGGAWFNGYAHFNPNKNEDHIKEAYNGLVKQVNNFQHLDKTEFIWGSYIGKCVNIPEKSVLFCDPPYNGTKEYHTTFDTEYFWKWAVQKSKEGHKVLITEYNAPNDFKCVWQKNKKDGMGTTISGRQQNTKTEKLFIYDKLQ